jgi:hypothetical protein
VQARVQDLLEAVVNPPERIKPIGLQKLINSLKLRIDGIPKEYLRQLPRRPLVHLTNLFNHCIRISHFSKSWKEAKMIALPKLGKDLKFSQSLRTIGLLSKTIPCKPQYDLTVYEVNRP